MSYVLKYTRTTAAIAVIGAMLFGAGTARASDCAQADDPNKGTLVELQLETGERLKGVYGGCQGIAVMLNHSLLGLLVIPRNDIDAMAAGSLPAPAAAVPVPAPVPVKEADADEAEAEAEAAAAAEEAEAEAEQPEEEVEEESPWEARADVGLNGSQGNSNDFYGTAGLDVTWQPNEHRRIVSEFDYLLDMNGQSVDDQVAEVKLRHDWLFPGSRWSWFAGTNWLYSEDENWDFRGIVNSGPAYDVIKNDWTELNFATGFGFSREFGGDDDDVHPEWIIGYRWKQKLTERWLMNWKSTYFQKLDDGEFRFDTELNFDYKLSYEHELALRFGIREKFNSDPDDGDDKDDFTYWLSLVWEL